MARTIIFFILAAVILPLPCSAYRRSASCAQRQPCCSCSLAWRALFRARLHVSRCCTDQHLRRWHHDDVYLRHPAGVEAHPPGLSERWLGKKTILAAAVSLVGLATVGAILLKNQFITQGRRSVQGAARQRPGQRPDVCREVWLCAPLRVHLPLPPGVHHRWSGNSQLL